MPPQTIIVEEGGGRHHHRHHSSSGRYYEDHRHHSRWRSCFSCFSYRRRSHSTHRYRCAAGLCFIALLAAFVLYLLPALSIPIIKPIYLFQINFKTAASQPATSIATNLRFGVWGACASSVLDLPTIFTNDGECTPVQIGYTIPPELITAAGYPVDVVNAVKKSLTLLLVLHPVAAGLSFVTLLASMFLRSQYMTILALIGGIITAVVGSIVLAADLALGIVANRKLHDEFGDMLSVTFGDAVWMIVAAVAMSWLGVITMSAVACRCCGIRRKHGWYGDGYYG